MTQAVLLESNLSFPPFLSRGKVRDTYEIDSNYLLVVATDRLSAFDVVMPDGIPGKGQVLTAMSNFWFKNFVGVMPHQMTGIDPRELVLFEEHNQIEGRAVVVKKLKPLPVEAIVRGYLIGSGWKDYQEAGAVCGITLPPGLQEAEQLPEVLFTPSNKAPQGEHDENISFVEMQHLIGASQARRVRDYAVALYRVAAKYALSKGIIIADTKFEFGLDAAGKIHLIDEVLTPDSSRFWPVESYRVGSSPPSYDKQFVRDFLQGIRINGQPWNKKPPAPPLPAEVIAQTAAKYAEALRILTS